jgi:hypothetical protein
VLVVLAAVAGTCYLWWGGVHADAEEAADIQASICAHLDACEGSPKTCDKKAHGSLSGETACLDCVEQQGCDGLIQSEACDDACLSYLSYLPEPTHEAPADVIAHARSSPCEAKWSKFKLRGPARWVGMPGYVNAEPGADDTALPWRAPTLKQVGPDKWDPDPQKPLQHRAPVTVVEQHDVSFVGRDPDRSESPTKGVFVVMTESGFIAVIRASSFTMVPYWQCPLKQLSPNQRVLVTILETAKPLDRDGRWVDVEPGTKALCSFGSNRHEGRIPCRTHLSKQESPTLHFEPKNLGMVY